MTDSRATEPVPDPGHERPDSPGGYESEPDVLLDVPELTVDEIRLAVDGLDADLSLRARLADLLQIDAGVRVHLKGVELDVTGVSAEALLKVRLEKLVRILDRALTTIDRNPQLIDALARSATAPPRRSAVRSTPASPRAPPPRRHNWRDRPDRHCGRPAGASGRRSRATPPRTANPPNPDPHPVPAPPFAPGPPRRPRSGDQGVCVRLTGSG